MKEPLFHPDRCCGTYDCRHDYALVRINRDTQQREHISLSEVSLAILDVRQREWKDGDATTSR